MPNNDDDDDDTQNADRYLIQLTGRGSKTLHTFLHEFLFFLQRSTAN